MKNHVFSVYGYDLKFRGSPSNINLLATLDPSVTYLVDNNVSIRRLVVAHPAKNFVIGTTVHEEAENLNGVLFNDVVTSDVKNAFWIEVRGEPTECIVIHRIDGGMRECFPGGFPKLSEREPSHIGKRYELLAGFRNRLFEYLHVNDAELIHKFGRLRASCIGDRSIAMQAAMIITAIHVKSLPESKQRKKLDPDYLNFPGDTRIICEALMFGFKIVSTDESDVHTMGRLAGLNVHSEVQ